VDTRIFYYIKSIARVLKKRFPNLTVEETLDIAGQILAELPEIK